MKVEPESLNSINVTPEVWATCVGTDINLYHEEQVLMSYHLKTRRCVIIVLL